jgi:mono/diheme cytochrome c family protein
MAESSNLVLGLYDTSDALMRAIRLLKQKKLGHLEAYTPYPIHGIDDALGLRRSPLGAMVMVMGILGASTAFGAEYWISAIDYPIVTGGKAPWSWEAFVPIMFEVTVLFATFTAGLGMLFFLNRLPFFGHPVLASKAIAKITRDQFALAVERDPSGKSELDEQAAEAALKEAGALTVEVLRQPKPAPFLTSAFVLRSLAGITISCLVAGSMMYWLIKLFPVLPPMSHMLEQPRVDPQQTNSFFADGRSMRMPVRGTVARGYMPSSVPDQDQSASLVNPLPRTRETLEIGRQKFTERCAVCHGALATGTGTLTAAYGGKPANLQAQQFRDYPDGKIYWVIVNGKNAMPSHEADLSVDQRWAIVHYVRALQRAQNATDQDIPLP